MGKSKEGLMLGRVQALLVEDRGGLSRSARHDYVKYSHRSLARRVNFALTRVSEPHGHDFGPYGEAASADKPPCATRCYRTLRSARLI